MNIYQSNTYRQDLSWLHFDVEPKFQEINALDVSSATAWLALDLLETLAVLSDTIARRSAVDQEDLKPYWKSGKNATFL